MKTLCQCCLKELEEPFETERQLCHRCNMLGYDELEELKNQEKKWI